MKRELIENVKVVPYASGAVIDRDGFLSGIFAASVGSITGSPTAAKLKIAVTESDTSDGNYAACADPRVIVEGTDEWEIDLEASAPALNINVDLDLVGCKRFVKVTATVTLTGGTTPASTNAYAIALGDAQVTPV
jgi:hypothetical protein